MLKFEERNWELIPETRWRMPEGTITSS